MKRRVIAVVILLLIASGYGVWHFGLLAPLGFGAKVGGPLTLYGNVDIRQVELGFRVAGRIDEMKLHEGDIVKKRETCSPGSMRDPISTASTSPQPTWPRARPR